MATPHYTYDPRLAPQDYMSDEFSRESSNDDSMEDDDDMTDDDYDRSNHLGSKMAQFTEMKEQMYQDKLADLKRQLALLQDGTLPEFQKRLKRLETIYRERIRVNTVIRDLELDMVEQEFVHEQKSAAREFEDQRVFLREQLINELEEKQKLIEAERHSMELTGDNMELKTISTRKLRRRANEPSSSSGYGPGERRRKPIQMASLNFNLDDSDILEDLKIINKNKAFSLQKSMHQNGSGANNSNSSMAMGSSPSGSGVQSSDIRVEDGKLFYQRRWFRRGQTIQVEPKTGDKYAAMISAISSESILVRRSGDNSKAKIFISQLTKGKVVIKKRAA